MALKSILYNPKYISEDSRENRINNFLYYFISSASIKVELVSNRVKKNIEDICYIIKLSAQVYSHHGVLVIYISVMVTK